MHLWGAMCSPFFVGIIVSRTRTTVRTSVFRAIEDAHLTKSTKKGVTKAILKEGELVDYVLEELITGIGSRAERMYAYAKSGAYTHGLPSGQFISGAGTTDVVIAVLEDLEGTPVTLDYLHRGPPNNLHIGWMKLIALHGYNPATNQLAGLTAEKGVPVYLNDMVVVIPGSEVNLIDPLSLQQWGISAKAGVTPLRNNTSEVQAMILPSTVEIETAGTTEYLRVEYIWKTAGGVVMQGMFNIPVLGYDDESAYFHARYTVGGVAKYWMYRDGASTYSTLDELFERPHEPGGSFFPFTYFRYNKHSEITDKTTDAFKTSKKLLKYLGMDYETVAAGVDKNPNIKDVEQAMLVFAVPANTNTPIEQRYLFDFFNNLYMSNPVDLRFASENAAKIFGSRADGLTMVSPSIVIKDTRFKMVLENAGIFKRRVAGNSGAVGSYASGEEATTRPITYVDSFTGSTVSVGATTSRHWYRHQVSKNFYDEIEVLGLRTVFHIWDQYATIGKNTDNILIIPLDHSITRNYSIPDRELLYTRSLHYVFNSRVTVFVEWYETGVFKAVLVVVAIVAIVVGLLEVGVKVLAFVIAGDYAAAAVLVILTLLVQLAVVTVFKLFVKITGIRVAFVIAVVAAVLGVADIVDSGSLAGAPFAQDLLTISTNLTKASSRQTLEDTQDLLGEAKTFSIFTEEKNKELDTAKKLLSNSNALNPFVIFGEAPQDFYNRTVHSGNIGTVAIDAISSYVDMALTLPKLKDSLGIGGY